MGPTSPTHEVITLIKFHDVRVKIVNFLVIAKSCLSGKFSAYSFQVSLKLFVERAFEF